MNSNAPAVSDGGSLSNTLQSVDVLDGGGGNDVLTFTETDGDPITPTLSNIETIIGRFVTAGGIPTPSISLSSATGVEEIQVNGSTQTSTFNDVGDVARFSFSNTNAPVDINNGDATDLEVTLNAVGDGDNINFVDNDVDSITLNTTNSDVVISVNSGGNEVNIEAIDDNKLNLNFSGDVETLNLTGTGSVDFSDNTFGSLETLDASGNSGGFSNIQVDDTAVSVTGSSGSDEISYNNAPLAASAVVNLGAGNDTLNLLTGSGFAENTTLVGGDGDDTLGVVSTVAINPNPANEDSNISGFETLAIIDQLAGDLDLDNAFDDFNNIVLGGGSGTVTLSGLEPGGTVRYEEANDVTSTLGIDAGGPADSFNIELSNNATTDFQDITINDIETLNLESGNGNVDHTVGLSADSLETLNLSGNAGLTIDTNLTTVETITSTVEGDVILSTLGNTNDVTITTDGGDDSITGGDGSDTLTGGNGDDTFTYTNAAESSGSNIDVVTDFVSGTDQIDISAITGGAGNYLGVFPNDAAANTALTAGGVSEALLLVQGGVNQFIVDADDSGSINANDLVVQLDDITELDGDTDIVF